MAKTALDLNTWNRKEHFEFFSQFDEPFFGLTVRVDCTIAYEEARKKNTSFYLYYLYRALKAANATTPFRYQIIDQNVYLCDRVDATTTVDRPDGTFGFSYIDYQIEENDFYKNALEETQNVRDARGLRLASPQRHLIQFSAIPWLDFTSLSHARSFKSADCSPKISFGKLDKESNPKTMPVSIHVHHGLMDARDVAQFVQRFQELLNH